MNITFCVSYNLRESSDLSYDSSFLLKQMVFRHRNNHTKDDIVDSDDSKGCFVTILKHDTHKILNMFKSLSVMLSSALHDLIHCRELHYFPCLTHEEVIMYIYIN